jgi:hypothetical protein
MVKSGPKTQAEYQAEGVLIPGAREPAPSDMEPGAKVLWEAIVMRLPADWFTSETRPLLKAYCRHANFADHFAQEITATRVAIEAIERSVSRGRPGAKKLPKLREQLHSLHKMHGYETDHAVTCATKLRLTNQSRYVPDKAASKARSALASGPPPWHDWGAHATGNEN